MDRTDPHQKKTTFMGTTNFFLSDVDNTDLSFWLFEFAFCAASATIVAGSIAERCQMGAYMMYSFVLTGWVYPIVAHTIWSPHGILSPYNADPLWNTGMLDFAGSGVVHVTGGITALIATKILGPRRGRFHDNEGRVLNKPNAFPPSSVALQVRFYMNITYIKKSKKKKGNGTAN
jgi:ammonium transporter, Amt family